MPLPTGTRLGAFEILTLIGSGGMGEVYRARDTRLDRAVAIKVLRPDVATDADRLRRFEQEARAASALNHPNILTIYEIGREQGIAYFAMEWVEGDTLRALLSRGRLPMTRSIEIAHQLAEGLAKAHAAGIVHRDLKPENVMVSTDGFVKIVDFGLAKLGANTAAELETARETAAGVVMGTVGYMSPEQASGRQADYRSDQFAFGLIVYEMATGKQPFRRDTAAQTMAATIETAPTPIRELAPEVPEHLGLVVDRCLQKNPNGRYDSTRDLARDLDHVRDSAATRVVSSPPAGVRPPVNRTRRVAVMAAIGGLAALAIVVAWAFWTRGSRTADQATTTPLVAVRPFRNLSANGAHDHFAAGMTEEIRGQLSKISALRLLSGAAVAKYAEGDVKAMVADLGVNAVIDGTVRLDLNRVRLSVELVDAGTGQMRWSDQYEREIADVFAVQSEIALSVARALEANLSPDEQARVQKRPTDNVEAYDLYLQSQRMSPLTDYGRNVAGMELLKQALALDPRFAAAKARLAYRIFFLSNRGDSAAIDRAITLAREAADLDPTLAYPHFVLGSAYSSKGQDAQARLAFMRALELDPNHSSSMSNLSYHEYDYGRLDDSLMWARRMFALMDRTGNWYYDVAVPLIALRDDALSWRWVTDGERRAPPYARVQMMRAYMEFLRGDGAGALARLRRTAERWPDNEEAGTARAELAYLTEAADAEALTADVARQTPDFLGILIGLGNRVRHAYFLKRRGDAGWVREADEVLRQRRAELAAGGDSRLLHLNMAAAFVLKGDREAALQSLAQSFKSGYREYALLEPDPIFAAVRSDARFTAVIAQMKAEVERQRRLAAQRGLLDLESLAPGIK
jgi:TolB-like protein